MSPIFDWEVCRLGMRERVKTRNDNSLRIWIFSQKLLFSVKKKMYQRQVEELKYTIPIRHITNISKFVWFQRSCGSMKSASSFGSIDIQCLTEINFKLKAFLTVRVLVCHK